MFLQEAGGNGGSDFAFYCLCDNRGLMFTECQHDDLPRRQDRTNAHRDRPPWDVLLAEEVAGRVDSCAAIKCDQARAAFLAGARFVKADAPRAPDAQGLNVNPASA